MEVVVQEEKLVVEIEQIVEEVIVEAASVVVLDSETLLVVNAGDQGPPGPPGPQGPPGTAASTHTHTQVLAAATWTITHGLGRWPVQVAVVDTTGRALLGYRVQRVDDNAVEVSFNQAWAGMALVS